MLEVKPIVQKSGDITEVTRGLVVHGCNALGVMGSGVAKAIRDKWSIAYTQYRKTYVDQGENLFLGQCVLVPITPELYVVNAITQEQVGRHKVQVDYAAVYEAFIQVGRIATKLELPVHFPLIGCGLAGGNWDIVQDLILQAIPSQDKTLWRHTEAQATLL